MKAWFGLPINGLDNFEAEVAPETWNGFPVPLVPHVYAVQIAEAVGDDIPGSYDGEKPYDGLCWQLICPECGHELTRTTTVDGLPAYCDYCDREVLDGDVPKPEWIVASFYGQQAAKRLRWVAEADYSNRLVCELFPSWQREAVRYAWAAAHSAPESVKGGAR